MELSESTFLTIIESTPLISIDLIIKNQEDQILLGLRNHRPAQGYWFVPGGRIMKNEHLNDAFLRITKIELGKSIPLKKRNFLGVFQHFYPDNFANQENISTQYIVLGVEILIEEKIVDKPFLQHSKWHWWTIKDLLIAENVHPYTKAYFDNEQITQVF